MWINHESYGKIMTMKIQEVVLKINNNLKSLTNFPIFL